MDLNPYLPNHWYDSGRGWDETNPGWYCHSAFAQNNLAGQKLHIEVLDWIHKNVDNPKRHCRWARIGNEVSVKFRYERDYFWFKLSF